MSVASNNPTPSEPLPLGVVAETGERLPAIDDETLAFFAGQPLENRVSPAALAAKAASGGADLSVDDDAGDPNHLAEAGWAVLYGPSVTDGIKKKLGPLLERRMSQKDGAGALYRVFAGKDSYQPGDTVENWLRDKGKNGKSVANTDVDPRAGVPYYILIVAPPHEIPFDFQFALDLNWAVGRLWFDDEDEAAREEQFGRYARSVVAYETAGSLASARQMVVFAPRNGQDESMNLLCDRLAGPMLEPTDTKPPFGANQGFRPKAFIGESATLETLDQIWRGKIAGGPPAVLFTGSHGMDFYSADERQNAEQGAIVCDDWKGRGAPRRTAYCAGADVKDDARVHGMIHFMFNCYGVGWPEHDTYSRLLQRHPVVAPQARLAALPQRLLAHPNGGALAVIGHVDRAWSSSYCDPKAGSQIEGFRTVMNRIMSGNCVGQATDRWNHRWADLSAPLSEEMALYATGMGDPAGLKNKWIARDDARNYIVFGDPAVRLRPDLLR